jgi:CRISPR-associated protein Cmr2
VTTHLLQLALGPVQGFIATARRSRDLWFGSYILSEISKAAARSWAKSGATLIFPSPGDIDKDLIPWSDFAVANVVTAELPNSTLEQARDAIDRARKAAARRWRILCWKARRLIADEHDGTLKRKGSGKLLAAIMFVRDDIWQAQLEDVVELFVGVVPLGASYEAANKQLRALVANRKNTRDFQPYRDGFQRPKSSLDGAQSTVIAEPANLEEAETFGRLRSRLGIEPSEQLDTAGMVKRVVGRRRGFLPAARVAAAPWLEQAKQEDTTRFDALKKCFEELASLDLATGLKDFRYLNHKWVDQFPYDGQLLYPERIDVEHARAVRELQQRNAATRQADIDEVNTAIDGLRRALKLLFEKLGSPCPYYGLLLADGDRMGRLINTAAKRGADAHREISQALSGFAGQVSKIMSDHGGACIYSGGDDVLGLVALPDAVRCGQALADAFHDQLRGVANKYNERPTLSVGIAIAHMLEPLGDVRELASAAEKLAKGKALQAREQGNALGLLLKPRGGSEYRCRIRWDDDNSLAFLGKDQERFRDGALPRGLAHELDSLWQRAAEIFDRERAPAEFAGLWRSLLETTLKKKRQGGGAEGVAEALSKELIAELTPAAPANRAGNDAVRARLDLLQAALWLSGRIEATTG